MKLTFVTGNKGKLAEVREILGKHVELDNRKIDLPEVQGEPEEIARVKVQEAARVIGGAALTEDCSLCFNALNGMPGPYIRSFFEKLGNLGMWRMLKGFEDKSAYAQCIFGYCPGPGQEPVLFDGRCPGVIVEPAGDGGFGWDPIFQPDGWTRTFAAMTKEEKNRISHRAVALEKVKAYFAEQGLKRPREE
eukprot:Hpha_TRINITY_DN27212_c0_g1::TRINITY_DN27212_c0_g1_i1::g.140662::m.140662/K01519/ITPA; inosine triphosphate pyrophosphatase